MCTHGADHPYVANWWPEPTPSATSMASRTRLTTFCRVGWRGADRADSRFEDAYQTQRVLEAALISAEQRRPVKLEEVVYAIHATASSVVFQENNVAIAGS